MERLASGRLMCTMLRRHETTTNWINVGTPINDGGESDETPAYRRPVSVLSRDGTRLAIANPGSDGISGNQTNIGQVRIFEMTSGWELVGNPIYREAPFDVSGDALDISRDGSVVAIEAQHSGQNGRGHVRVFHDNGTSWEQRGNDIDGENEYDLSGCSVSLPDDGNTVAIGAQENNGFRGHLCIYRFVSGTWVQLGSDIDGLESGSQFGMSVSLSSDGTMVAGGGADLHVRIFSYNQGNWNQIGQSIEGDKLALEWLNGVSLSTHGGKARVAICTQEDGGNTGFVRVFEFASASWLLVGDKINFPVNPDFLGVGNWVSLSTDGSRFAVGRVADLQGEESVQLYEFD